MPDATHNEKICIKCGLDCSDRPRVKDANGNYACKSCVEDRFQYRLVQPESRPSGGAANRTHESHTQTCAVCLHALPPDLETCNFCGFDPAVGLQPYTGIGRKRLGKKGLTCEGCGYDLTGLPTLRCPECGNVAQFKTSHELDREMSERIVRWAYLTPLLMLTIAGSILFIILSLLHSPTAAAMHFAGYVIHIPIGIVVYFACCLFWIGFDAPLHLTALRLAGVYTVVDVAIVLVTFIPVPGIVLLILWIVPFLLYVYLLAELLDMDTQDAFIVAIATSVTKYAILAILVYLGYGWV